MGPVQWWSRGTVWQKSWTQLSIWCQWLQMPITCMGEQSGTSFYRLVISQWVCGKCKPKQRNRIVYSTVPRVLHAVIIIHDCCLQVVSLWGTTWGLCVRVCLDSADWSMLLAWHGGRQQPPPVPSVCLVSLCISVCSVINEAGNDTLTTSALVLQQASHQQPAAAPAPAADDTWMRQ